jgi:hypothetical protein
VNAVDLHHHDVEPGQIRAIHSFMCAAGNATKSAKPSTSTRRPPPAPERRPREAAPYGGSGERLGHRGAAPAGESERIGEARQCHRRQEELGGAEAKYGADELGGPAGLQGGLQRPRRRRAA